MLPCGAMDPPQDSLSDWEAVLELDEVLAGWLPQGSVWSEEWLWTYQENPVERYQQLDNDDDDSEDIPAVSLRFWEQEDEVEEEECAEEGSGMSDHFVLEFSLLVSVCVFLDLAPMLSCKKMSRSSWWSVLTSRAIIDCRSHCLCFVVTALMATSCDGVSHQPLASSSDWPVRMYLFEKK